jgi:hypothetical protein
VNSYTAEMYLGSVLVHSTSSLLLPVLEEEGGGGGGSQNRNPAKKAWYFPIILSP